MGHNHEAYCHNIVFVIQMSVVTYNLLVTINLREISQSILCLCDTLHHNRAARPRQQSQLPYVQICKPHIGLHDALIRNLNFLNFLSVEHSLFSL